jgi:alkyldihydroxyacetonephosphate synthase
MWSYWRLHLGCALSNGLIAQSPLCICLRNEAFLAALGKNCSKISFTDEDRAFHAHGHSCQEIFNLRQGSFARVPDVVIWPGSHQQVENLVQLASTHNVVIIPYGGGTTVTHALLPPVHEKRMIVSLDMHHVRCNLGRQ